MHADSRPLEVLLYDWGPMVDERRHIRRILVAAVLQRGHGVGLLTPDNVGEFVVFRGVVASPLPVAGTGPPS